MAAVGRTCNLTLILYLWLCYYFSCVLTANQIPGLIVNTTFGPVRGKIKLLPNNKTVLYYLGIPYASAGRFEPPKDPDRWNLTMNATAYRKVCPQPIIPMYMNLSLDDLSETCHFINVFVPAEEESKNKSRAVMLYVHAGGYTVGAGSRRIPELPGFLATEGNVIVVTFNYRVGIWGFLASKEANLRGNYGLLDQIQALKWVQNNIKRFGGNPNQVTLFGLSSGGMSIGLLMLSRLSEGLFHRVIMQSGVATALYAWLKPSEAEDTARDLAEKIGCSELSKIKDCLKSKTLEEIFNVQLILKKRGSLAILGPVVDGYVLEDEPTNLLKEGKYSRNINVLSGITKDDGGVSLIEFPGFTDPIPGIQQGINRSVFLDLIINNTLVRNETKAIEEVVIHKYTDWSNPEEPLTNRANLLSLSTDHAFRAPLVQAVEYFAKYGVKSYVFQLDFGPSDWYSWLGVYHGADFRYMFGYPLMNSSASPNDTEVRFSRLFIKLWSNFAKTGNPTPGRSLPQWPVYTTQEKQFVSLKPNMEVKANMQPDKMNFWNVLIQQLVQSTAKKEKDVILQSDDSDNKEKGLLAAVIVLAVLLFIAIVAIFCLVRRERQQKESLEYDLSKK